MAAGERLVAAPVSPSDIHQPTSAVLTDQAGWRSDLAMRWAARHYRLSPTQAAPVIADHDLDPDGPSHSTTACGEND
jgi:hypothetical protein